jgi:ABC-2 type transport system ATP-binding protein
MIMEILLPDNGRIEIFGEPNSAKARERLGYLPEERGLYKRMKVMDTLGFFAELKGVKSRDIRRSAEQWMEKFDLSKWRDHRIEELSRGMQQKLQFICTVLPNPRLVILDEPFTGLDPVNTNLLKDTMLELKNNGTTIIFSTHLMDQVEKLCESICLIDHGKNLLYGSLSEIKKNFGKNRVIMRYRGKADFLQDRSLVAEFDDYGQYVEIQTAEKTTPQQILQRATDQVVIESFQVAEPTLNEIFISMVKKK